MSLMSEYIKKKMDIVDYQDELKKLIKKYNENRGTYLFVFTSDMNKRIPGVELQQEDYYIIVDLLKDKITKKLDFYIETPGGSGETAVEIVDHLRRICPHISFIVSGEAKSAGTIMVLSGDEILMTDTGSLGPIDAQIRIGRSLISAQDYKEWVEEKRKEAENKMVLNPFDAVVVAQISPGELKGVYQSLSFAEDLVKEWLPKYKFKNWKKTEKRKISVTNEIKVKRAEEIAQKLMDRSQWRSHGRSIKIDDLKELLKITRIDDDPILKDIVYRIQTVCKLIFDNSTTFKLYATADETIFHSATPVKSGIGPTIPKTDVVEAKVKCKKCGKEHGIYFKFLDDPKIDKDFKKKGSIPYPKDGKFKCDCGYSIDLTGFRNQIELQVGKRIIT